MLDRRQFLMGALALPIAHSLPDSPLRPEPLLDLLEPSFQADARLLLSSFRGTLGPAYDFKITTTLRSPWEQAILWRRGRSAETVRETVDHLLAEDAVWIAGCLSVVGPQFGSFRTKALPGQSWHQYGKALDLLVRDNSLFDWWIVDSEHEVYETLGHRARFLGLTTGIRFRPPDGGHVQGPIGLPGGSLAEISRAMEHLWGPVDRWPQG